MILREAEFLSYADLKGIEKPEFAINVVKRHSRALYNDIFNIEYYRDRRPNPFMATEFSELIQRLEAGSIWLINNGPASDPAIANIEEKLDEHTSILTLKVTVSEKLNLRQYNSLEYATRRMTPLMGVNNEPPVTPVEYTPIAKPTKKKDRWIGVQLLDDYGDPIPNVDVIITDYEGQTHNATLDSQGMCRVDNIVNGACEIEVVDVESVVHGKPSYPVRPENKSGEVKGKKDNKAVEEEKPAEEEKKADVVSVEKGELSLNLKRIKQTNGSTLGELTIDGQPDKKWYVVEPGGPDSKKTGNNRIMEGSYEVTLYEKSGSNYSGNYQLKGTGRDPIVFYPWEKTKGMMTGLCPGKGFEFEDGDYKQFYKVTETDAAIEEIYEYFKNAKAINIVIKNDLHFKALKSEHWVHSVKLNRLAAELDTASISKGSKLKDEVALIQEALNKVDIPFKVDGDFGNKTRKAIYYFQKYYESPSVESEKQHQYEELKTSGDACKDTLLALDEALVNEWKLKLPEEELRVRAFLSMIRVGEGTVGDIGYETLFGGKSFIKDHGKDWNTHPKVLVKTKSYNSTAAGAYQIMEYTYQEFLNDLGYLDAYSISDFKSGSQDDMALILLRHKVIGGKDPKTKVIVGYKDVFDKKQNALELIVNNEIEHAIELSSFEWASLPPSRYGQPNKTVQECIDIYEKYLESEKSGSSSLNIDQGFINRYLVGMK